MCHDELCSLRVLKSDVTPHICPLGLDICDFKEYTGVKNEQS